MELRLFLRLFARLKEISYVQFFLCVSGRNKVQKFLASNIKRDKMAFEIAYGHILFLFLNFYSNNCIPCNREKQHEERERTCCIR